MAMAGSHPEVIFDGKTPIADEGVPDRPWRGDRYTDSYVDIRRISLVIESLNKCCGSDPDGSLPVGLISVNPR
jgi:hypothetical protein